ncbi:4a-hydroxytetrahydrobiopterin dehydratase [Calidifontibacter indicus]|uniref:Putative pterin-4-alpha-carbinolamine dehydratase n=1 Tax=Calidifontibacter indicus TaxID=419650 RepID=A0A3D9UPQ1_9MICO|nr:4a-hydroxytetrahydrobiopterin dehydratase [Calidifontibacter indicus]REF31256.1 4a-hydroxytetrahydrobiopterin dehydratase [Calidifontibacter indicus]
MSDSLQVLTAEQVLESDLPDWRQLYASLHTRYLTTEFANGLRLVAAIGAVVEAAGHHPEITLTQDFVDVSLTSHDAGGVTARDVELARAISAIAAEQGVDVDGDEVHGQAGIGPTLWFQHREPDDEQRFHLDVRVPHDIAAQRIQQVVDAGGTVVRDGSPAYVVLQDVDGNKACICTNLGREGWSAP